MVTILIGLLVPMLGIVLSSAVVFLTRKEMSGLLQKSLLGFAAGVMHVGFCRRSHALRGCRGTHT